MASLYYRNGRAEIQYTDHNRQRRTVRLGRMPERNAKRIFDRVDEINTANCYGQAVSKENAGWIAGLPASLAGKLAAAGLIVPPPDVSDATLGAVVDRYIATRTDVKPSTRITWKRTRKHLLSFFGEHRPIASITAGDAKDFRVKLLETLADNTVRKTCSIAKQFFQDAIDREMLEKNPFRHKEIPTSTGGSDDDRVFFVTREMIAAVLDECPDAEWRLIVALCRYGGLRCPSEVIRLTWADVYWDRGRMTVRSPKTEHHKGKASRTVPIFPELRPYLEAAYEQAADGATHVVPSYRTDGKNFRTRFERIIERAGLTPWPKLFQNLRSTRQTELLQDGFKAKTVCAWLGNSLTVSFKHYEQVTDDDYDRALNPEARQNARQSRAVSGRQARKPQIVPAKKDREKRGLTTADGPVHSRIVGDEGLEPPTLSV